MGDPTRSHEETHTVWSELPLFQGVQDAAVLGTIPSTRECLLTKYLYIPAHTQLHEARSGLFGELGDTIIARPV